MKQFEFIEELKGHECKICFEIEYENHGCSFDSIQELKKEINYAKRHNKSIKSITAAFYVITGLFSQEKIYEQEITL